VKQYEDAAKRTAGVLFLGTPHRGFELVRFAKLRARLLYALGSNSSILEGLGYDSLVLKDLHSEFFSSFHQLQLVNIYEQRKTVLMKFGGLQLDTSVGLEFTPNSPKHS
jgi:hypothetical protein